jgi:GxxExxY protein
MLVVRRYGRSLGGNGGMVQKQFIATDAHGQGLDVRLEGFWVKQKNRNLSSSCLCGSVARKEILIMELDDLTYQINGAIYEVNRELGSGFLEKVYENALLKELALRGIMAESQVPMTVRYKGESVGEYFADVVVESKIILELKTVEMLKGIHEAQLLNYLKATGCKVGLLVNFTYPKAEIRRFVF